VFAMFGRRQEVSRADLNALREEVAQLRSELHKAQSEIRAYQTEQVTMHSQVQKWMRRAVAAERVVDRNQDPTAEATAASGTPGSPQVLWGAAGRMLEDLHNRRARVTGAVTGEPNGVHP
jgi:chromosome segregation ATPase